jgi:hypothetical protein
MPYDEKVYENTCVSHGHTISSFPQEVLDAKNNTSTSFTEIFCSHCGMSLDEIRTMKIKKTRKSRKGAEAVQL